MGQAPAGRLGRAHGPCLVCVLFRGDIQGATAASPAVWASRAARGTARSTCALNLQLLEDVPRPALSKLVGGAGGGGPAGKELGPAALVPAED